MRIAGGYRRATFAAAVLFIAAAGGGCQSTVVPSVPGGSPPELAAPPASQATAGPTPPILEGPTPALARFQGPDWHFDYPVSWSFHPDIRRAEAHMGGGTAFLGFLTSQPFETRDACEVIDGALRCNPLRVVLGPGEVLIEMKIDQGYIWGSPVQPWTRSDPDLGELIDVAGVPARVGEFVGDLEHSITWSILNGRDLASRIQIEVEVQRPNETPNIDAARALMRSWAFDPAIKPLDPADAAAFAAQTVRHYQDRLPGYECFPEEVGVEKVAMVTNIGGYGLSRAIRVTCTTTIDPTELPFWRVRMTAHWEAAAGSKAGDMVITQFLASDGTLTWGTNRHASPPYCCV